MAYSGGKVAANNWNDLGVYEMMGIQDHWLLGVRRVHSPHRDCRSIPATDIDLLVLHGISLPPGEFGGPYIEQFFCNQLNTRVHPYFRDLSHFRVSAHVVVYRSGEPVQFVPFDKRAWHAGESEYQGRVSCNDFSIGIELEGVDDLPYAKPQYFTLAQITVTLLRNYPCMRPERIVAHSDISPGRKDWTTFRSLLRKSS
jgi:N-acetyl-anhydromuramoyl-L-alanine amidase